MIDNEEWEKFEEGGITQRLSNAICAGCHDVDDCADNPTDCFDMLNEVERQIQEETVAFAKKQIDNWIAGGKEV